ncbi:MAG: hypothetical protein ACOYMF_09860 [Bacteroidales bacterium]
MAAAGKWKLYEAAKLAIANGEIDFDAHSFRIALFLSTSNCNTLSGTTGLSNLTNQVASNYGYTQSTKAVTIATSQASDTVTVDETTNPVWTASGGSITARFAVIYDDTHASKQAVCVCLLDTAPADVTATDTNTLTITQSASGLFTISGGTAD